MMKNGLNVKLNKKYFSAVFAAVAVQIIFGVNLVNGMQCEKEIEDQWAKESTYKESDGSRHMQLMEGNHLYKTLEEAKSAYYEDIVWLTSPNSHNPSRQNWDVVTNGNHKSCGAYARHAIQFADYYKNPGQKCVAKYLADNSCKNIEVFIYKITSHCGVG